jgi:hypothetical protein
VAKSDRGARHGLGKPRTLALFPEDYCDALVDDAGVLRLCLSPLTLIGSATYVE